MGQSGIKPDKFVLTKNYTVGNSNMMMMKKVKYLKQQTIDPWTWLKLKNHKQSFVSLIINTFELLIERDFKILL